MDDPERVDYLRRVLSLASPPDLAKAGERDKRLARMFLASIGQTILEPAHSLQDAAELLWEHPQVRAEILELLECLERRINHLTAGLADAPSIPLRIHAQYTRHEILGALGIGTRVVPTTWQSGVYWAEDEATDLLAFTLDKTIGQFSPTTSYRDYAISPDLIHWESQSITRSESETGSRYQEHERRGSKIYLFARLNSESRAFWFLGPASYVRHEGERPMAVVWRLQHPLPGDLFSLFASAVA